jgi:hypothetical protein
MISLQIHPLQINCGQPPCLEYSFLLNLFPTADNLEANFILPQRQIEYGWTPVQKDQVDEYVN